MADPLGGSDYVEWMTDEMERQAEEIFAHLLELGDGSILEGVYEGIESGYFMGEIADAAYRFEREVNAGRRVIVGVNAFTDGDEDKADDTLLHRRGGRGVPAPAARQRPQRAGRTPAVDGARRASPPTPPTRRAT